MDDDIRPSQSSQTSWSNKRPVVPPKLQKLKDDCLRILKIGKTQEDEDATVVCYTCREGGKLIMCDEKGCAHGYHLKCVGLKKLPTGSWKCPWHECTICQSAAALHCVACSTAYCKQHYPLRPIRTFKSASMFILCPECTLEIV